MKKPQADSNHYSHILGIHSQVLTYNCVRAAFLRLKTEAMKVEHVLLLKGEG